jgi:NAD(P)-dependent dehydrogenase (short-subunit alcohol dehydrogenase family)
MVEARTAIVTGGGKRVGADIAIALVERGWTVLAHVRRKGDPVPAGATAVVAELGDADCADRIFAAAERFPPVRLLVNNASRFQWDGLGEFSLEEFDVHMHVNVRAPVLLTQAMAARHGGGARNDADGSLIVNILDSKLSAPNPDFLSYTLSKQALAGFTQLAARALASSGIRVNAIAPGLMLKSPGQSEANFQAMHERNPLGQGITTGDVVAALDFLIAAGTVTGQVLTIDGGLGFDAPGRDVQFL